MALTLLQPFNLANTLSYTFGNVSATGNVQANNIATTGPISTSGNITGNYFLGNGSLLTGIDATSIQSGTSNVKVVSSGGNVTAGIGGTANVLVIAATGTYVTGLASVTGNVIGGNVNTGTIQPTSGTLTLSTASNGNINIQPNGTGNIVLSNTYVNSVRYPIQDQDAATKVYVDNLVSTAISYHEPVAAATTTTLATTTGGTITYNNGTNGVGATLTTTGAFNLIDTANVQTANTRILIKDEANATYNGVYVWSNATVITRSTDTNTYGAGNVSALGLNDYFFVSGGNVNKGSAYVVSAPTGTITFGTSNITFAQFSSSQTYTANTSAGITLAGTVINAKTDGTTTAFDGGGNIIVKASATLTTPNIGAATGTSLSVTGNIDGGNLSTAGLVTATGNITGNYFLGNGSLLTGIDATSIQSGTSNVKVVSSGGNVTASIGGTSNVLVIATTGTYVTGLSSITGNVIAGNVTTAGLMSATGNINGGNLIATTLVQGTTLSATGNVNGGNVNGGANVNATTHTGTTVSVTGLITGGNLTVSTGNVTLGNIVNAGANGVGNIGSSTLYFNTVFAKATSAQYADLAEMYEADGPIQPGTVVAFGGSKEVTTCNTDGNSRVAGVVSTNPSYIMNAALSGEHVVAVALIGRVPTRVTGTVAKGDMMVSAGNGRARADVNPAPGQIIGKALADFDGTDGTIEIVVGRF